MSVYAKKPISRTKIFIQRESFGEIRNKTALHFTVCGNEEVTLVDPSDVYEKNYHLGQTMDGIWAIDFKERFKSTDPNCPAY